MSRNTPNVWAEFAIITGGNFIEGLSWHSDKTEISYNGFKIVFDNYTLWSNKYNAEMTRVVVSFLSIDNFRFEIYRTGLLRKIETLFGAQDVKIGHSKFDKEFIIKANDELKIAKLLGNVNIQSCLDCLAEVNIQILDTDGIWEHQLPEGILQLSFFADGEIKDFGILGVILDLFKELLDDLSEINSITHKES